MTSYPDTPLEASCPVCYCTRCRLLYVVDANLATKHLVNYAENTELMLHIERLWQGTESSFVRCEKCRLCFAWPFVPGDSEFYSLLYNNAEYVHWKWEYSRTYDILAESISLLPSSGREFFRLLEIGAGTGEFVKRVAPALISMNQIFCIEYSESGAQNIRRYGIDCSTTDVFQTVFPAGANRFDAICMFQVLEHMDKLDALFQRLSECANDEAQLFIAVPNDIQRELYDHCGVLEDIPPTHITRWNKKSFEIIGLRHGWELVRHETEPQSLLSKLKRYMLHRFSNLNCLRSFTRIQLPILRRISILGALLFIVAPISLRAIWGLTSKNTGVSQLAHFRKTKQYP